MISRLAVCVATIFWSSAAAIADTSPILPLASHRAAYDISLVDPSASTQAPISATGLIAYEFRGSTCEGYTQHIERLIDAAKRGGGAIQARVYDGSDTGAKIFVTMSVIGKEATKAGEDAQTAQALGGIRRWPVVISYFDEALTDSAPEYTLSFDLYENGVSGSLKLDYGAFALHAHLRKLEILPTSACSK
jgi:hypothetical protein